MLEEIERANMNNAVSILGFVPDSDLPALYSGARAFLFPTYYEGFGLPILESMACGTPVLIGNRGAAPEVADGRAVSCDPFDVDSIASKIEEVADASREELEATRKYAQSFRWERNAEQACALYRDTRVCIPTEDRGNETAVGNEERMLCEECAILRVYEA